MTHRRLIIFLIPLVFVLLAFGLVEPQGSASSSSIPTTLVMAGIEEFDPQAAEIPNVEMTPLTTIYFTGDINPGRCIAQASQMARDFTYPFQMVAEKLRTADITVGSLDGTISDQSIPMSCPDTMNLIGPSETTQGLQFAGFDVITVATNHARDCGEQGWSCNQLSLIDTFNNLTVAGIKPVGTGSNLREARTPVLIERNGIRFAFLGIDQVNTRVWAKENQPGAAPLSSDSIQSIKADISAARQIADIVIVLPHWGSEYSPRTKGYQREWAREFMDAGATLVVGNHPHVVQSIEVFPNGVAFYALGNFVFDQPERYLRESIVVEANFRGTKLESWHLLPVILNYYTYQPHWAEGAEGQKVIDRARIIGP